MIDSKTLKKAIRVASKKLPIVPDKRLNADLEWAADSLAEAYRIGAEEAQSEILKRLRGLSEDRIIPDSDGGL